MKGIVLDTNVLLVSISTRSRLHWIFKNLLEGKYKLCVTTDILAEYAEIVEQHMGYIASQNALGVLENLPHVQLVTSYYKFGLLQDEDDNKFVDCAIASNAEAIVTHDKHFNPLKTLEFPKVSVIDTVSFQDFLAYSS